MSLIQHIANCLRLGFLRFCQLILFCMVSSFLECCFILMGNDLLDRCMDSMMNASGSMGIPMLGGIVLMSLTT